jgi:hypothetical protein
MKPCVAVAVFSLALTAADVTIAWAGCSFGPQSRGGTIGAHQTDRSRFYTSDGHGRIIITVDAHNGNLEVSFPGHCGPRTARTVTCHARAGNGQRVHPIIHNPNNHRVNYTFSCTD